MGFSFHAAGRVKRAKESWNESHTINGSAPAAKTKEKPAGVNQGEVKLGPRAASQAWTPADDAQLLTLLDSKMDRALIAWNLKRTVSAISKRRAI
jgi:hypothetical protein